MNIQTNERTYITDLRTKLKQQFIQEMHNANKDPEVDPDGWTHKLIS
ncbi:hypothetical protein [Vibrio parahaemolyticus]|nr:hypothetical protein [Vibrio parahaemolyticus]